MTRSFIATMNRVARASGRAARANARLQVAQVREQERHQRLVERVAKQTFHEDRFAQTEEENRRLDETVSALRHILRSGLASEPHVDFSSMYQHPKESALDSNAALRLPQEPFETDYSPKTPGWFGQLFPWVMQRYEEQLAAGTAKLSDARATRAKIVRQRSEAFAALQAEAELQNKDVELFKKSLAESDADAIVTYYKLIFEQSEYPNGFPGEYKLAYSKESKQLVIDVRLPTIADIVPSVERYKYVKSTNQINETRKTEKSRQSIYIDAICQAALRCLSEAFKADPSSAVDVVALNGYVATVDPGTGRDIRPYIISVRISRDEFAGLDLNNVDPTSCLKRLHATVSRSLSELVAIKPIVDINMFDPRFVQEQDVLSTLDSRPNLMELTPSEFESLITNLFQKMGLETKLTQASRDGGVDCVAYDARPVLGGKVIVQAKRYKNTVGVSAVRDLFGTVHNEGASKGILVTTSGYGKAAYDFANGKPLELITGSNLLYMLKENSGIDAKIVMPDDWVDPAADS
jgi:restriction system protein